MASITIIIADTPAGGISIRTDYQPAVGQPCSRAQSAALDMIRRTRKDFGLPDPASTTLAVAPVPVDGVDIDRVHHTRDNVYHSTSGAQDFLPGCAQDRRFIVLEKP